MRKVRGCRITLGASVLAIPLTRSLDFISSSVRGLLILALDTSIGFESHMCRPSVFLSGSAPKAHQSADLT